MAAALEFTHDSPVATTTKAKVAAMDAVEDVVFGSVRPDYSTYEHTLTFYRLPESQANTLNTRSTQSKFDYKHNPIIFHFDILVHSIASDSLYAKAVSWDYIVVYQHLW